MDKFPNVFMKAMVKQAKREARIEQLELILTIVTTLALAFVSFALAALIIYKINDNKSEVENNNPIVQKYV